MYPLFSAPLRDTVPRWRFAICHSGHSEQLFIVLRHRACVHTLEHQCECMLSSYIKAFSLPRGSPRTSRTPLRNVEERTSWSPSCSCMKRDRAIGCIQKEFPRRSEAASKMPMAYLNYDTRYFSYGSVKVRSVPEKCSQPHHHICTRKKLTSNQVRATSID